jgi:hypothetical protein
MGFAVGFMSVSTPMCVLCGVGAAFAWQRLQLASRSALEPSPRSVGYGMKAVSQILAASGKNRFSMAGSSNG